MQKAIAFLMLTAALCANAQTQPVTIQFKGVVGAEDFDCGRSYKGIGATQSTIRPKDFRFYVHNVRVLDETGKAVTVELKQDEKWQLDDLALIDFENGKSGCSNGTPETNTVVIGTVPAGHTYSGLQFTVGVPFEKNHTDLTRMPSPLDLTALAWVWNAGRKFMRVEVSTTGKPRGWMLHLGSTGCTPNETKITVPTTCLHPNRPEITLPGFDPRRDQVTVDLAALLKDSDIDGKPEPGKPAQTSGGCMSSTKDKDCVPFFANLGLALTGSEELHPQSVFRASGLETTASARR
jgi:uncharacterized repeat protein (TIGR04052 family)